MVQDQREVADDRELADDDGGGLRYPAGRGDDDEVVAGVTAMTYRPSGPVVVRPSWCPSGPVMVTAAPATGAPDPSCTRPARAGPCLPLADPPVPLADGTVPAGRSGSVRVRRGRSGTICGTTGSPTATPASPVTPASSEPSDSCSAARAVLRFRWVTREATAAITHAAMANQNAIVSPSWNGCVIRRGKKLRPVR